MYEGTDQELQALRILRSKLEIYEYLSWDADADIAILVHVLKHHACTIFSCWSFGLRQPMYVMHYCDNIHTCYITIYFSARTLGGHGNAFWTSAGRETTGSVTVIPVSRVRLYWGSRGARMTPSISVVRLCRQLSCAICQHLGVWLARQVQV